MSADSLRATVVVPVLNLDLNALVAALRAQSIGVDQFEVVIADDGSTAPLGIDPEEGWLRIDTAPHRNSYAARNRGARLARGEVLAFCDADCVPAPDWLEHGLAAFGTGAAVVAGEVWPRRPRRLNAWALIDADDSFNQERAVREGYVLGGNVLVSRDVFDRLGGFDEMRPSGGDFDFARRAVEAGARLVFTREAVVTHPTLDAGRAFLRRAWLRERYHASREGARRGTLLGQMPKLVPGAGAVLARKQLGRPLLLDRSRIGWDGGLPARRTVVVALALRYLVLPYVAATARAAAMLAAPTSGGGMRRTAAEVGAGSRRAAREG